MGTNKSKKKGISSVRSALALPETNTHHLANMSPTCPMDSQRMVKVNACMLQTLPGLERLGLSLFEGKTMRQLGRGQEDDEGNDISGFFVVADGGAAVIFHDPNVASRWANNKNQVNIQIAPSLTYVDSGNSQVTLLVVDQNLSFSNQNLSRY